MTQLVRGDGVSRRAQPASDRRLTPAIITSDCTACLNDSSPVATHAKRPGWGGVYDKEPDRVDNNFQFIEVAGRKFLILGLEFGPRKDVVRWANEIAGDHPDHEVILLTHVFVYHDDTRYDWQKFKGKQSWNPHTYGVAKNFGDDVCDGGDGWLRLVELRPDGTAQTFDYSPTRGQRNESPHESVHVWRAGHQRVNDSPVNVAPLLTAVGNGRHWLFLAEPNQRACHSSSELRMIAGLLVVIPMAPKSAK